MADRANLSRQMIGFVEQQKRVPTIDTLARISRAFGILPSRLLAEAEEAITCSGGLRPLSLL
jgi:transcriptional regulator with XRE-family HTH domain